MQNYLQILEALRKQGIKKGDRTGTGTYSLFGPMLHADLRDGFPLLTTKKVHYPSIVYELLWFLRGDTNIKYLHDNGVTIWDEWADEDGELGPVYGNQWRTWGGRGIDQLQMVIDSLRHDPDGRRHIVSAWNVQDIEHMALPPCHLLYQFYVGNGFLSCKMYQRSADYFLGVPFNLASYALLTLLVAHILGLKPGMVIISFGDCHLYTNHWEQAEEQLRREPKKLPRVRISPSVQSIDHLTFEDFELIGYDSHPAIKAPISK